MNLRSLCPDPPFFFVAILNCFHFLGQSKEEIIHKLLRSSQKLIHVGHPEGEPLHDKVMALKLEFKQFKKRVNERKENLKKHLSFCEQGKEVVITKLILFILDSSISSKLFFPEV